MSSFKDGDDAPFESGKTGTVKSTKKMMQSDSAPLEGQVKSSVLPMDHDGHEEGGDYDQGDDDDDGLTGDQKKMKRVLANRHSARASYQRRKKMMSELQSTVALLTKQNSSLEAENKRLREEISELKQHERIMMLTTANARAAACPPPAAASLIGASALDQLSLMDSLKLRLMDSLSSQHSTAAALAAHHHVPDISKLLSGSSTSSLSHLSPHLRTLMHENLLAQTLAGLPPPGSRR